MNLIQNIVYYAFLWGLVLYIVGALAYMAIKKYKKLKRGIEDESDY